jgi:hypothetical protein
MAMYLALAGAASTALDILSSLTSPKSSSSKPTTGVTQNSNPFSVPSSASGSTAPSTASNWGQSGALSPDTWNALLAAQSPSATNASASPSDAMKDLFSQIDVNGDGSITKSEFEQQLGAGGTNVAAADDVFAKLDTDGDGSVSMNELTSALQTRKSGGSHHAHGGHGGGGGGGLADALSQSIDGATTTTTTNADGSTTTTLTYADGSKVTSTSAASSAGASSAASSYNLIEKLIQSQSQAVSNSAAASVKV